jgi:ATP-binding cassette subfamily C (CFTR/MRP) protein 4
VNQNELLAIIGKVGSGKSSLLMALLEEMHIVQGKVNVRGNVFYVPQEPWIFTGSIKQNILFGKEYDKQKFREVIKIACLDQDLRSFEQREKTLIGEKGINLSGGQRARISVARALYSDADIYLFDDPLSAVDANVAKSIFDKYFLFYNGSFSCFYYSSSNHSLTLFKLHKQILEEQNKNTCDTPSPPFDQREQHNLSK